MSGVVRDYCETKKRQSFKLGARLPGEMRAIDQYRRRDDRGIVEYGFGLMVLAWHSVTRHHVESAGVPRKAIDNGIVDRCIWKSGSDTPGKFRPSGMELGEQTICQCPGAAQRRGTKE